MVNIDVIGLGIEQPPKLAASAKAALVNAQVVYGSQRQLDSIANDLPATCQPRLLPKLTQLKQQLPEFKQAAVLASGDPLYFGIGRYLLAHFPGQVTCHAGVSSIQGACHTLGIALQEAQTISLHGRPLAAIRRYLRPQQTLIIIPDNQSMPHHLAQECHAAGLPNATLHVVERMGYTDQQQHSFSVTQLLATVPSVDKLHITVIETGADLTPDTPKPQCIYPTFPGIEDHLFITDAQTQNSATPHAHNQRPKPPTSKNQARGMLTKREVRLAVLSLLQGQAGEIGWDIGAGCGGVAVEWALWNPKGEVYAIEHHAERYACLQANRDKFGVVQNLHTLAAAAPAVFNDLPRPNKIFVGGSSGDLLAMLNAAWKALLPGGRLVATAVMEQSKADALQFYPPELSQQDLLDAPFMQVAVSRGDVLAGQKVLRPNMAVMLYQWDKPYASS